MAAVEKNTALVLAEQGDQLVHEMFVLDAFLVKQLDQRRYRTMTRLFVSDLLDTLRMEPLGALGIYPAVDEREPGWSFIQPITTSHVSAHYFENPGRRPHIRFDAYSCATVNWSALIDVCHRHFELESWRACFINRQLECADDRSVIEIAGKGGRVSSATVLSAVMATKQGDRP